MKQLYPRIAGIDVHKKMLAVVIRPATGQPSEYGKRRFGTTRRRSNTSRPGYRCRA